MSRFVMATRRARRDQAARQGARDALARAMASSFMANAKVVADNQSEDRATRQVVVFDVDAKEDDIRERSEELGDNVIVEREILHYNDTRRPAELLGFARETLIGSVSHARTRTFGITVTGEGNPLPGARVTLYLRAGNTDRQLTKVASSKGNARFKFSPNYSVSTVVVEPAAGYWPMSVRRPSSGAVVDCPALPDARDCRGWWHRGIGIDRFKKTRGRGIKVGVVDSGLGAHPWLTHCEDIGAYIDGHHRPRAGADVDFHGTHVCGIIGARPTDRTSYGGIASGVSLTSARVFPKDGGASQVDIAAAIDALSQEHQVDLINLSLGARAPSEVERDAIVDAAEHGTLCVCAAANSNGPVEYPAAFEETLAIAAVGLEGWGPAGSLASQWVPRERKRFGLDGYYHASFSCFGTEVDAAAPGVGIISTVPRRFGVTVPYAAADGTSMASPAACAVLATLLSDDEVYRGIPRDTARTNHARALFEGACQHIGLTAEYQGRGMPRAV